MLPEDCELFFSFLRMRDPIVCTTRDSASSELGNVTDPCSEFKTFSMWRNEQGFKPTRQHIEDAIGGSYYRIDDSAAVLEFTPSQVTEWQGSPALLQGRIWGAFRISDERHDAWFSAIRRWIRKHLIKIDSLDGYVAPAAQAWHQRGGLLLPMFTPPATDAWLNFFEAQSTRCRVEGKNARKGLPIPRT